MLLTHRHEARLDWFFGVAQSLFERSSYSGLLNAAIYNVPQLPDPELLRAWREREPWDPWPGEVTARPRPPSRQGTGYTPDEDALEDWAQVSGLIKRVAQAHHPSAAILAAYYGDQGARWGRTVHGRIFACYELTEAGRELLKRSRKRGKGADLGLSAGEELENQFNLQRIQPMPARGALQDRARNQALRAYAAACRLYMREVGDEERGRSEAHALHHARAR